MLQSRASGPRKYGTIFVNEGRTDLTCHIATSKKALQRKIYEANSKIIPHAHADRTSKKSIKIITNNENMRIDGGDFGSALLVTRSRRSAKRAQRRAPNKSV